MGRRKLCEDSTYVTVLLPRDVATRLEIAATDALQTRAEFIRAVLKEATDRRNVAILKRAASDALAGRKR
jgi:metal-responsive CopG/Arc/MetJ family transcriptional regulator